MRSWLFGSVDPGVVRDLDVELLTDADKAVQVGDETAFAIDCVECGNEVGSEGITERVEDELKHFCCPSCQTLYLDRYEELAEGVD